MNRKTLKILIFTLIYTLSVFAFLGILSYSGLNHGGEEGNFSSEDLIKALAIPFFALLYPFYLLMYKTP